MCGRWDVSGKIEALPSGNWSARAAAANAVEELVDAPPNTEFIALWWDGADTHWSKTALSLAGALRMSAYLDSMARYLVDQAIRAAT